MEWGLLLGMPKMGALLERWRLDEAEVRRRMYRAPTPRERQRWSASGGWLLTQGWTATAVAQALGRDAHTIGEWARAFAEGGPKALVLNRVVVPPPRMILEWSSSAAHPRGAMRSRASSWSRALTMSCLTSTRDFNQVRRMDGQTGGLALVGQRCYQLCYCGQRQIEELVLRVDFGFWDGHGGPRVMIFATGLPASVANRLRSLQC